MFKYLTAFVVLCAGSLLSETVGPVEFQFPPSSNEWKLLVDQNVLSAILQKLIALEDVEDKDRVPAMQIYLHREGDALETFCVFITSPEEADDDEEADQSTEPLPLALLNLLLPNHAIITSSYSGTSENSQFISWEVQDANVDLMHGVSRTIQVADKLVVCGYSSTASKTEYNANLWMEMLSRITVH